MLVDPDGREIDGPPSKSQKAREASFAMKHPFAASRIGIYKKGSNNISTNSVRFATRGEVLSGSARGEMDECSENGAFRHVIWQASITSEFGSEIAQEAGNSHENNPNVDLSVRNFSNFTDADQTVDLLNNQIGRRIGEQNKGKNMQELSIIVLDEFKNNGLYTASQDNKGTWNISLTKLPVEKYSALKIIYKTLNSNGRTHLEQNFADKKRDQVRPYIGPRK